MKCENCGIDNGIAKLAGICLDCWKKENHYE